MDFISLFLVIGIAADNVLLLYNTYQLAPALHRTAAMTPAEKMRWAYREAAGRMLVTTATTCGSFYANALSIVRVVRGFGLFTGTLIAWNFLNVLTIFSASVLVNDIYMVPCLRRLPCCRRAAGHAPEASPRRRLMQSASNLARQFTKDGSRALQLQPARLDRVERFVDQRFRHCLVPEIEVKMWVEVLLGGLPMGPVADVPLFGRPHGLPGLLWLPAGVRRSAFQLSLVVDRRHPDLCCRHQLGEDE